MKLAIVRHGKAEPRSHSGRDRDRMLIPRGQAQASWLGQELVSSEFRPALILSSPFERAIATARLIKELVEAPLELAQELECDLPVSRAVALIEQHRASGGPLMLVGHNPQLSHLVATLIAGPTARSIELKTGEAALLELDGQDLIGAARLIDTLRWPED